MKLRQEQPGDDIISVSEIGSMNIAISVLTLCRHIDTIHYIQTWIIDCCADEIRNSFEPLVQLCSLSVTQWVSHSIIHSVGSLVSQSVRPSVSQSTRRAFTACPGVAVSCVLVCLLSYLRHRFPFFWCAVMMHREMRWCTPYNGCSRSMDYCRAITEQSVTICFSWISWFECCWLLPYENVVLWDDARILDSSYLVSTTFFY